MSSITSNNKFIILAICIIILLGTAAYWNSLEGDFIWDDNNFIKNNTTIKSLSNLPQLFRICIAAGSYHNYFYYRPLQELTYMLDYHLWGLNPKGFHITSIIIHILASLCVFWLIFVLSEKIFPSFLAAVLFCIHPIQVESVSYLSGRGDPLGAMFISLTLIFYIKSLTKKNMIYPAAVFILFTAAIFTKENAIITPAFIAAYHFSYQKRLCFKTLLPVFLTLSIYVFVRVALVPESRSLITQFIGAGERVPSFFVAFLKYLSILCFPYNLHFAYGQKFFSLSNPAVIIGFITFIFVLILPFILKRKKCSPLIIFSILWFIISLLPYSNIYKLYSYFADHHLYLASIGFFTLAALFAQKLLEKDSNIFIKKFGITAICSIFLILTILQNNYWIDPIQFYKRTLKYVPGNTSSYINLGAIHEKKKDFKKAKYYYEKAIKLAPNSAYHAYNSLGVVYAKSRDFKKAIELYNHSLHIEPLDTISYNNLGLVYLETKQYDKAILVLKKAVTVNSRNDKGYYHLGLAYYLKKSYKLAEQAFNNAIWINPKHKKAYFHLAAIYIKRKDEAKAEQLLRKGFRNENEYAHARQKLSQISHSERTLKEF